VEFRRSPATNESPASTLIRLWVFCEDAVINPLRADDEFCQQRWNTEIVENI
jgi:hypothetical protein